MSTVQLPLPIQLDLSSNINTTYRYAHLRKTAQLCAEDTILDPEMTKQIPYTPFSSICKKSPYNNRNEE